MEKNTNKMRKILICHKIIIILCITVIAILLNKTLTKATDETVISAENWSEWQEEDYWDWHTRTTSSDLAYNGEHIIIQNDAIDFYGYGQTSYKDFLYKEYKNKGKKTFKFIIDETKTSYHTLDGAGFIFNATIKENKISGYILLFMEEDICVYRIEDVDIEKFENTESTVVADYGELIKSVKKPGKQIHKLSVETSATNIKIEDDGIEILSEKLDYSKHVGESFGLIASYLEHNCDILSEIEFSKLKIIIEDDVEPYTNKEVEEKTNTVVTEKEEVKPIAVDEPEPKQEQKQEPVPVAVKDTTRSTTSLPYTGGITAFLKLSVILSITLSIGLFLKLKEE